VSDFVIRNSGEHVGEPNPGTAAAALGAVPEQELRYPDTVSGPERAAANRGKP